MLLAADIGGTKTLIGLFDRGPDRPIPTVTREYVTLDFDSFEELADTFIEETGADHIEAVCAGVAGPITGYVARLTSAAWVADILAVARRVGDCPADLVNDLQAMAAAIPVLERREICVLQAGMAMPGGNAAILAAGTGMGQAFLHNLQGQFVPVASEGGHADFAARTRREIALVEELTRIHGRVEVEAVLSGRGLVNLFRFTHQSQNLRTACPEVGGDLDDQEMAPAISACALERRCERCVEALEMFAEAYGAEAGNLALRSMATAGVYVGGGIAPKILPALEDGRFMDAFLSKDPMTDLLRTLPVKVILNPAAALLGAAVLAAQLE